MNGRPGGWVSGIGWVALLRDLDGLDIVQCDGGESGDLLAGMCRSWCGPLTPLVVTRWADGSKPEASGDDLARLAAWKSEAIEVIAAWEQVWDALGRPGRLGQSKAAAALAVIVADDTVQVPRAVLMDLHAAAKDIEDELPALVRMGDHLARRVGGSAIFPSAEAAIRSADFLATTLKALYGSERGDHG